MIDDYYTAQKQKLLADFDAGMSHVRPVLASRYGADTANMVLSEARDRYGSLIPQLPYVGGNDSPATGWLILAAWNLAIYQAVKAHGGTVEAVGKLLCDAAQARYHESAPLDLDDSKRRFGRFVTRMKLYLGKAPEQTYPGGWVGTFIEGDGEEFDVGIDWTECGACKFLHAHDADELAPYLCRADFVHSKVYRWGLQRTMTLAEGHEKCDFRFKPGRETAEAWPPPFLRMQAGIQP